MCCSPSRQTLPERHWRSRATVSPTSLQPSGLNAAGRSRIRTSGPLNRLCWPGWCIAFGISLALIPCRNTGRGLQPCRTCSAKLARWRATTAQPAVTQPLWNSNYSGTGAEAQRVPVRAAAVRPGGRVPACGRSPSGCAGRRSGGPPPPSGNSPRFSSAGASCAGPAPPGCW